MDNYFQNLPGRMNDSRIFTDYRTSDTRELSNMRINNMTNEHEYRITLQQNGESLINAQWEYQKQQNTKQQKICPHNYPTRVSPNMLREELKTYTNVFTGKASNAPKCQNYCDFKLGN
jgi:hypothetical protein